MRNISSRIRSAEERIVADGGERLACSSDIPRPTVGARELQQARSLIHAAERALKRGKHEEAEVFFIRAITANPSSAEARAKLAKLYLDAEKNQKAEAMYGELIGIRSSDAACYANLGLACFRQGKFEDACAAYRTAFDLDPLNPERQAALGRSLYSAGRPEEAVEFLERAAGRLTRDISLLKLLGECLMQVSDTARAEDVYRKINKIQPYDEEVKKILAGIASAQVHIA